MRRLISLLLLGIATFAQAGSGNTLLDELTRSIKFRPLGPAVTGGRIIDIEVHPSAPYTIFAASASGGLWKTTNNGTTWKPVFDDKKTISIGDVAIAPSDPKIVWVGTGEHNNQRSAHYGDGVYKSTDGGETWQYMGLPESYRTGRIAIDPKNPNTVYVATMGYLYKPGGQKGVFRTTDGGKTWNQVLKGDNDTTGFIDITIDPKNPRVLYAAAMDRLRRAWNVRESGPGSGLYKTSDGGNHWERVKGGFPEGDLGRIGVDVCKAKPNVVYTTVINAAPGKGIEIYRSDNSGKDWKKVNEKAVPGGSYYGQIHVDPKNPERIYVLGVNLAKSDDGGKTYTNVDRQIHVDHHALWIDPADTNRVLLGNDGGMYMSYDCTDTWEFINNLPIPQFYAVSADMAVPYNVMGGLQDNGAWHGPSRVRVGSGISNTFWINVTGGDGFYTVADWEDPYTVYTSSQFGGVSRYDVKNRASKGIRPRNPEGGRLRCNWMTPFFVSPHDSKTIYWGSQFVHKSTNRGDSWETISPDLTTNNEEKIKGNVPHCTITTMEESKLRKGVIWVGTDDGNVWLTQDDGKNWTQVNGNIPGAPKEWWVSRVHASPHDAATAFVSYTGFREDDFTPMIWKTTDYGQTWTSIVGDLPKEQVAVIKQDPVNPDLLFVGTEVGCHFSVDGGKTWSRLSGLSDGKSGLITGLPTVAVQDLVIHPRDLDLILGTHGRGIYIADVSALREYASLGGKSMYVFKPAPAVAISFIGNMFDPFNGMKRFTGPNPPSGATITYYLKEAGSGDVKVEIVGPDGKTVREITGPAKQGLNSVNWNLRTVGENPGVAAPGRYKAKIKSGDLEQVVEFDVLAWTWQP